MSTSISASDSYRNTTLIIQRHEAFMRSTKRAAAAARRLRATNTNTSTSASRLLPNADARPTPPPAPVIIPTPVAPGSSPVPSLSFLPATLFPVAAPAAAAIPVVVPTPLGSAFAPRPAAAAAPTATATHSGDAMDENTVIPPTDDDEADDDEIEGKTAAERHARLIGPCETDTEDEVEPVTQPQPPLMHV